MADRVGQQLGNYRLLRKIGQGAFAEVYLGEHQYLERLAAIKVLHVQIKPKTHERFRREARTIAHLRHPNIVQVLDFGLDDQTPYLVMEYTPGGTLRSHYPKGIRLPVEQIVIYVKQIASALDYAHQQRVIHRDIKPDNLLLNANHEVVLSDFGLAVVQRSLDSSSLSNPAAGTPLYMAPEQIQQQPCAASDQYALGIMVYEWLVGEAPFHGTPFEVFSHHLHQPPPSLRDRLPDLSLAMEEAVFKALAKDPQQRFFCVADFASALEQAYDATQPFTLPEIPKQHTQEPTVSSSTLFVPPSNEQEHSSSSTQPTPVTVQQTERGEEVVPMLAPGPSLHLPTGPKQGKSSVSQNNRHRFLRRVRTLWIDGVLEHSLHGAALLALALQEQLDALANPWHLVLHHPDTPPRAFPAGTCITDIYDAANGELLILGAPGSGKTTLLLELARNLLDRAEYDEQHLMPVVFPLSSWAAKQQPLSEWMIEELINKYDVPRILARAWVDTNQILPLLDGLDEVGTEKRTACIETINTYHQEHTFFPLMVTSRSADYVQQTGRVRLTSAVSIQSLTQQQVDDYLARGGESLWALRVALHQDATLRELTETPLMLSILTLTYHDMPVEDLLRGGIAPTRQQVFEHYIERMLTRRGGNEQYRPEQTKKWLARLAWQMKQQGQTVFSIERMQRNWLPSRRWLRLYRIAVGLVIGLLYGAVVGLVTASLNDLSFAPHSGQLPVASLLFGLLGGLIVGVPFGLFFGLISGLEVRRNRSEAVAWSRTSMWRGLTIALVVSLVIFLVVSLFLNPVAGLITGMIFGLSNGLTGMLLGGLSSEILDERAHVTPKQGVWRFAGNSMLIGLLSGLLGALPPTLLLGLFIVLASGGLFIGALLVILSFGLFYGLLYGLFVWLNLEASKKIKLAEIVIWSWVSMWRNLWHVRGIGLTVILLCVLIYGRFAFLILDLSYELGYVLTVGLVGGLVVVLLSGLIGGLSSEMLDERTRVVPNQGIRRSTRNGIVAGLLSGLLIGLATGVAIILLPSSVITVLLPSSVITLPNGGLDFRLILGLVVGLDCGLVVGLVVGLLSGGIACIQHCILRLFLLYAGDMPLNYPRFLDYAAQRILLRKVGGGYIFVHRLLLEYFASLDRRSTPDTASGK